MASRRLTTALNRFTDTIEDCRRVARDAQRASLAGARPRISTSRRDWMLELAFLRGFLAWEGFIEESCLLYMMGESPMRGRALVRYVMPPNRKVAMALASGNRKYASWDDANEVKSRAERFFRDGRPFATALSAVNVLDNAKIVRNAVAHDSDHANELFERLVRRELGALPPRLTVGSFLNTLRVPPVVAGAPVVAAPPPPIVYLEYYLQQLELVADQIAKP